MNEYDSLEQQKEDLEVNNCKRMILALNQLDLINKDTMVKYQSKAMTQRMEEKKLKIAELSEMTEIAPKDLIEFMEGTKAIGVLTAIPLKDALGDINACMFKMILKDYQKELKAHWN